jgi:hypothetical protein
MPVYNYPQTSGPDSNSVMLAETMRQMTNALKGLNKPAPPPPETGVAQPVLPVESPPQPPPPQPESVPENEDPDAWNAPLGQPAYRNITSSVDPRAEDRSKLPQDVSMEFYGNDGKTYVVRWSRDGNMGMSVKGGNMVWGQRFDHINTVLDNVGVRKELRDQLKEAYQNRKAFTRGESRGIITTDEYGNEIVIKATPGKKVTIRGMNEPKEKRTTILESGSDYQKNLPKDRKGFTQAFNDPLSELSLRLKMMGLRGQEVQGILSHYASSDRRMQEKLQDVMNEYGKQQEHRTKYVPEGGHVQATIDANVMRVGKLNPSTGKWYHKSFKRAVNDPSLDARNLAELERWMGSSEYAQEANKKWKEIQGKTDRGEKPDAAIPVVGKWNIWRRNWPGAPSREKMANRYRFLKQSVVRTPKEDWEFKWLDKQLHPTKFKKENPNAVNIKQTVQEPEFKPGETTAREIVTERGGLKLLGTHGTVKTVIPDKSMWERGLENTGQLAKQLGVGALQFAAEVAPVNEMAKEVVRQTVKKARDMEGPVGKFAEVVGNTPTMRKLNEDFAQAEHDATQSNLRRDQEAKVAELTKEIQIKELENMRDNKTMDSMTKAELEQMRQARRNAGLTTEREKVLDIQEAKVKQLYQEHIDLVKRYREEQERLREELVQNWEKEFQHRMNDYTDTEASKKKMIAGAVDWISEMVGWGINLKGMLVHSASKMLAPRLERVDEDNKKKNAAIRENNRIAEREYKLGKLPEYQPIPELPTGLGSAVAEAVHLWTKKLPPLNQEIYRKPLEILSAAHFRELVMKQMEEERRADEEQRKQYEHHG